MAEADRVSQLPESGHIITDWLVRIHVAVRRQHHGHGRGKTLGDRVGWKDRISGNAPTGPEFKFAEFDGDSLTIMMNC